MKKYFLSVGLMVAAAFTLTNCTQEIDAPVEPSFDGVPFEIVAKSADTKTTNNGLATVWAEGDALNLFHGELKDDEMEYSNDGEFKFDADNTFKGKLTGELAEGYCYNWYAIYPYQSQITTPANTSSGWQYFGSRSDRAQTQNGNDSMAHIAGSNYPLYGVCEDWEYYADEPVEIEMTHLTCLLEVNVTNNTAEDLLVSEVLFTAPENKNIVGTFYVNFAGKTPSFTDGDYVSNMAKLEVANGAAIATSGSAKFYLAVKPFVAAVGEVITLKVNDLNKNITLSKAVEFNGGEIVTLNFNYKEAESTLPDGLVSAKLTFDSAKANRTEFSTSKQVWAQNGIVFTNEKGGSTTNVADYAAPVRIYKNSSVTISAPGNITKIEFDSAPNTGTDGKNFYLDFLGQSVVGSTTVGNVVSVDLDGTSNTVNYTMSAGQARLNSVTVTYKGEGSENLPEIVVAEKSKTISVDGGTLTFAYTLNNLDAQTLNCTSDSEWLSATLSEGNVNVTVEPNDADPREGKITLTCGDAQPVVLNVSQAGVSQNLTVAEFRAKEVNENVFYTLRGTITNVANTTYGNFDITDATGTVYIYGLCSSDGATNKYWATSGAKLGDDIVISVPRTDFNGTPQGKNARFIELVSPGTYAFYKLSEGAVNFQSAGGEEVVTVTAYNTDAEVTASCDNAQFSVAVSGNTVTITSAANTQTQDVEGTVTITVGNLEPTTVKVTLAAKPAEGVVEGGSADFNTISSTNTSYVSGITSGAWSYKNCCILKGGTSDSSPTFKMIGDASNRALCMNGKTSAVGSITSPTLTTGCGTLKFNYGLPFSDTQVKFRVDIKQNDAVVKTFTVNNTSATQKTKYSHEEVVNVSGDFQIVFTNLSPSNSTSNKDRTAIWDVEWTGCAN